MGIRIACRQLAARTSLRSLLVVPFIILAAACSENATEPVQQQIDGTPSLSLADAQSSGLAGPILSKLAPGKCMDYDSNGVIINSCDGSQKQSFTFKTDGSIRASNGSCVAVDGDTYAARVLLRQCNGSEEQRWSATSAGELRGIGGKCVGVAWNRAADGTKLVLWTCNGTESQKWDATSSTSVSENEVGSLSITGLQVATGKSYKIVSGGTTAGALAYIDRTYHFASPIPSAISGATFIRPSNDDKFAKLGSSNFMSFTVNQDVDVYVAFDNEPDLKKPSWLTNSFTKTSTQLGTDRDGLSYTLYKKSFAKGTVTLGANTTEATDGNMYVAIIVPKGGVTDPTAPDTSSSTTPPDSGSTSDPAPSDGTDGGTHSGIFVSPSGSSSASGTESSPMSLSAALSGAGGKVSSGDTVWVRGGSYSGDFTTYLSGSSSAPVVVRAYPGERATINGTITAMGSNVWFWGLEVANKNSGEQSTAGITSKCSGCRFINMVIHDHSSNGLQMWSEGPNQEAYGNIIYNNGFYGQSSDHAAHGIYAQNQSGTQKILDNLLFNQYGYGIHIYGSDQAYLNNYTISGNVGVNNGIGAQAGMSGGMDYQVGGGVPLENLVFTGNMSYRSSSMRDDWTARVGYSWGPMNYGGTITNNYFVGPWILVNWSSSTITNNTILDSAMPTSTRVVVEPNKYEAGRANVIIYNWGKQGAVSVDLSKVLSSGDSYEVRNAQNFYASPVASGMYSGGSISIPVTSITPPASVGGRATPVGPGTEFNAYVVVKK
jgi:hypothetical protein